MKFLIFALSVLSFMAMSLARNICDETLREFVRHCSHLVHYRPKRGILDNEDQIANPMKVFRVSEQPDFDQYEDAPITDQARSRQRKATDTATFQRMTQDPSLLAEIRERRRSRLLQRPRTRGGVLFVCDFKLVARLCGAED